MISAIPSRKWNSRLQPGVRARQVRFHQAEAWSSISRSLPDYFFNIHQPGERANRRPLNTRLKPGVPFTGLFSSPSLAWWMRNRLTP